jgi:chloride channel protein, CIC family
VATWRGGGHIEPSVAPRSAVNSLVALVSGGPVGFEAALTGLLGGTATWVGHRITVVGQLIRQASGAEEVGPVRGTVSRLPYWLAGLSGLLTYHWLPFGKVDLGFRFEHFDGRLGVGEGLAVFAFAVLVVVPAVWAVFVIGRAERATVFRRNPILVAMAGGLLFALLAVPNDLVLFSGQQGIQLLPEVGAADLSRTSRWRSGSRSSSPSSPDGAAVRSSRRSRPWPRWRCWWTRSSASVPIC